MISNFGSAFGDDPFGIYTRMKDKVREDLRYASPRKLRSIVRAFEKIPFWKRNLYLPFCYCNPLRWDEKRLRFSTARAVLLGELYWEKLERGEKKQEEEKARLKREIELTKTYVDMGRKVELFTGNLLEWESRQGKRYEVINPNTKDGTMRYSNCILHYQESFYELGRLGVEALINFKRSHEPNWMAGEGIPVKKRN